ncbi:MAG: hypothetical protein IJ494_06780 [Bacteroides sp.]|nr:hypothetical protein [Bacteroides sp.]
MALMYQKVEKVLHYKDGKPTVYQIAQQTIPPVTFNQLVEEVAMACGVNATMTKAVTEGIINRMSHFMELGHAVQFGEFGTFKPTFTAKTQDSVEKVSLNDVKRVKIRFYPGQRFKNMLSGLSIMQLNALENVVVSTSSGETSDSGSGSTDSGSGDDENLYG